MSLTLTKILYNLKNNIFPIHKIHEKVWLMDDHKWAFYLWEKYKYESKEFSPHTLVHLDRHWDAVFNFRTEESKQELAEIDNIKGIYSLVESGRIIHDSFIAPAIIRGLIDEIHFFCKQKDTEIGIDPALLEEFGVLQCIHPGISSIVKKMKRRRIFLDVDLDVFNKSEMWCTGNLWDDKTIKDFIIDLSDLIIKSKLITIALSYNYSGTQQDTEHLANLVIPEIMKILNTKSK